MLIKESELSKKKKFLQILHYLWHLYGRAVYLLGKGVIASTASARN